MNRIAVGGREGGRRRRIWAACAVLSCLVWAPERAVAEETAPIFIRGDVNLDRRTTLADVILILRHLSLGDPIGCKSAADVDDSGRIEQLDALALLGTIFYRHEAPPAPFVKPGPDPTPQDGLGCRQGLRRGVGGAVEERARDGGVPQGGAEGCQNDSWGADLEFIHFRERVLAAPGEGRVRAPIEIRSPLGSLEGFTVSVHAPTPWIELKKIEFAGTVVAAHQPDWIHAYTDQVEAGYLTASVAMSLREPFRSLPRMNGETLAFLEFAVAPSAPIGARLEISFADTPGTGILPPIQNEVSRRGFPQQLFTCGLIVEVVSGEDVFIRGDVDRDRSLNLTDAIAILRALFLPEGGVHELPCPDAADADDDGSIGVTDAIQIAGYLFGQAPAPSAPYPAAGRDFDPSDDLGCAERP